MLGLKERTVTSKQMREIEQKANDMGLSFLRLMENAGSAAFVVLKKRILTPQSNTVVLCGNGNNGGDGFVVARKLFENNYPCIVVLTNGEPKTEESRYMFKHLKNFDAQIIDFLKSPKATLSLISECDVAVDAVFGTGFHGEVDEPLCELFSYVNKNVKHILSLDIPSGICADSAQVSNVCVMPEITVAFSSPKPAHVILPTKNLCGEIVVSDIGIEEEVYKTLSNPIITIDTDLAKETLLVRNDTENKGNFGRLINVSGSENFSGAAILSTKSALRSGVGLVTLATDEKIVNSLRTILVENTFIKQTTEEILNQKCDAILLGCGLSQTESAKQLVKDIIKNASAPIILDADGINALKSDINILKGHVGQIVMTPHIGEFARLLGKEISDVKRNRFSLASDFSKQYGIIVVLKDYVTVVSTPQYNYLYSNPNSGMAKGGSGDVLAGIIASLVAQGYSLKDAAVLGVYIHGQAGSITKNRLGEYFMQPSDVIDDLSDVFKKILK